MISKYTYKKLVWIDVQNPSVEEINRLKEEYAIPSLVTEELLNESTRAKVEVYDNLIFMIMHFPTKNPTISNTLDQEVDFVVGKDFVITVHYEAIDALHTFSKQFNSGSKLERGKDIPHAGFLLHFMTKELYLSVSDALFDMHKWLKDIEKNIFSGNEEKMVFDISNLNRIIIDYTQSLRFHKETLIAFQSAAKNFFGSEFSHDLTRMLGEYNKVQHLLDGHKELLHDLRETNNSLLETKTNKTVKKLTALSFIMLPLSLIVGVFGMNMDIIFIQSTQDLFVILLSMLIVGGVMYWYFKATKWF